MSRHQAVLAAAVASLLLVLGVLAGGVWALDRSGQQATSYAATRQAAGSSGPAPASAAPDPSSPASARRGGEQSGVGERSEVAVAGDVATGTAAGGLDAAYKRELGALSSRSGVAIVPLGGGTPIVLGSQTSGVAWSTIKVPIAVAAAELRGWRAIEAQARAAITRSDNDAARTLWASLGSGRTAAGRVEAVLAAAGDPATRVQHKVVRAGYTSFGQTPWALSAQARVMGGLACRPSAARVVDLMTHVVPAQRWGLGRWRSAPIKGGWGPLATGRGYLVRQMGVVPVKGGHAAVALLVKAPRGFDAGVADADRIAAWVAKHAAALPGGRC